MFNKKRLLIVAGPTGCGKSTFLSSALGSKPSPLTKKLLKNAFTRSDFKIEKLYLRRLKKLYEKQGRFQKFIRHYNNFVLDVDTTGIRFKKNALIFPRLFAEFDHISSIQIFTPYEIWLNRILERKINFSFKYSMKVRRILHDSFSLKSQERRRAEKLYHEHYKAWESYLEGNNIKNQCRLDTTKDIILEPQFK